VALSDELDTTRPVTPVQFAGEHLVLFRDGSGSLGLLARHCPHRGVDLCHARLEDNGVRCPFHGWHFARNV
jgi:phthalate 4,5-dioxygenase oxygenase subunit